MRLDRCFKNYSRAGKLVLDLTYSTINFKTSPDRKIISCQQKNRSFRYCLPTTKFINTCGHSVICGSCQKSLRNHRGNQYPCSTNIHFSSNGNITNFGHDPTDKNIMPSRLHSRSTVSRCIRQLRLNIAISMKRVAYQVSLFFYFTHDL